MPVQWKMKVAPVVMYKYTLKVYGHRFDMIETLTLCIGTARSGCVSQSCTVAWKKGLASPTADKQANRREKNKNGVCINCNSIKAKINSVFKGC